MARFVPLFLGFVLLAAACGDDNSSDQAARQNFCDDLDAFFSQLKDLGSAVVSLDRPSAEDAYDQLQKDFEDLKDSADQVRSSRSGELESEYNDLKDAVEALFQSGNLSADLSNLQSALSTLTGTLTGLLGDYNCS